VLVVRVQEDARVGVKGCDPCIGVVVPVLEWLVRCETALSRDSPECGAHAGDRAECIGGEYVVSASVNDPITEG
jgi:hypothetical protein